MRTTEPLFREGSIRRLATSTGQQYLGERRAWFRRLRADVIKNVITNPILPGFNPDPSICRVGDDFFIATSTFEWFPGVQVHHSRDLAHWRLLCRPLDRISQLDLRGNRDSGGVWAPCLTWHGGLFYLVYTDTKGFWQPYNDQHNYLVTAPDILGPWSEPIPLVHGGFDPSLFHDEDERSWLLWLQWDHRLDRNHFGGIMLQEFDRHAKTLVGAARKIFTGTELGKTEGPHLYRRRDWYYLMTAEGGTSYDHAVTLARSRTIDGPYEVHPENPLLTSRGAPDHPLQKAGHGSLVETQHGEWYLTHLVGRPVGPHRRCILGRETALQKCRWDADDWLRLAEGGCEPQLEVQSPKLPAYPFQPPPERNDFDLAMLPSEFQTLRVPSDDSWLSLTERPGWLRLRGRDSPASLHRHALVGRRIEALNSRAVTKMEFQPRSYQQMAGLLAWYNSRKFFYLCQTFHEQRGSILEIVASDDGRPEQVALHDVSLAAGSSIWLSCRLQEVVIQFGFSTDGHRWQDFGPELDATRLSDDYGHGFSFTGSFFALACHDLSGAGLHADFDWFEYRQT